MDQEVVKIDVWVEANMCVAVPIPHPTWPTAEACGQK